MRIQQFNKNRQMMSIDSGQKLRPGQVIQGNILKLYPNERAQIRLGSQQFIAQLHAPLSVGKSYHFQIEQVEDELIHLKVISETSQDQRANLENISRYLGLKGTRHELGLIQSFINESIPFQRSQFIHSSNLLRQVPNKNIAQKVIKQMVLNRIPIQEHIFQALYTAHTSSLTDLFSKFNEHIHNLSTDRVLSIRQWMAHTFNNSTETWRQAFQKVAQEQVTIIPLLQSLGISAQASRENTANKQNVQNHIPVIHQTSFHNTINHLLQNERLLIAHSNELLEQWSFTPMNSNEFAKFTQITHERIIPLLAHDHQLYVTSLLDNSPDQLSRVYDFLTHLADRHTYTVASQLQLTFQHQLIKQQFITQLSNMTHNLGLSYENMIANDIDMSEQSTLKGLLIQLVNDQSGLSNERTQQLLQMINGLQIQALQESTHMIQANITMLGEQLGLHNDIRLEFEGNKKPDGTIDPDFCRILFYLDLAFLHETVIDMNIQKRLVSVTIFNDMSVRLPKIAEKFKPTLKDGLSALRYELTSITCKPLQKKKSTNQSIKQSESKPSFEGIDFRV